MVVQSRLPVEEFSKIADLPENAGKRLELIGGEIVEVVTSSHASVMAVRIVMEIGTFLKGKNLGYVTGADGGYVVFDERYIPDVGFISKAKQPEVPHEPYIPVAPDLAVEIVAPTDSPKDITDKVVNYLAAGTLVWAIYPDKQVAKVYEAGRPVKTIFADGTLDGGSVLPGFQLALKVIFPEETGG